MHDSTPRIAVLEGAPTDVARVETFPVATLEDALASAPDAVLLAVRDLRALVATSSGGIEAARSELRHDLNNDLTAVLGFSQLLLQARTTLPPNLVVRAERIYEHATRMSQKLQKRAAQNEPAPGMAAPPR